MVYLIHFDQKYKHSQHYLGFVEDGKLDRRMIKHAKGIGARLLQVIQQAGITWQLVRVWPDGDRNFERQLKNHKKSSVHCPLCNATHIDKLYKPKKKRQRKIAA